MHYRNVGDMQYYIARAQRRLGHQSYVIGAKKALNPRNFHYDHLIDKNIQTVGRILTSFDAYHFYFGDFLPGATECFFLRMLRRSVFHHYCGSEAMAKKLPPLHRLSDARFVHSPQLLSFVPDAYFVPIAIDLTIWRPSPRIREENSSREITILHGPSDIYVKGSKSVIKAVKRLKSEGYTIRLIQPRNVRHRDMISLFNQADIVVDQLLLGWYGAFSVEAMAMEKPVCVYVREEWESYLPSTPYLNSNVKNITENLRTLVEDEALRRDLGVEGREFCKKFHDSMRVTKQIMKFY